MSEAAEARLVRLIAQCVKRQEQAENDEAEAMLYGQREAEVSLRRVAAQQLWKRRKYTKQLDDLRAKAGGS